MAADIVSSQKDTHYSEEIDHLLLDMIGEVSEIEHLLSRIPGQASHKYVNDFIPHFTKLYDLTGDYLEIKHPSEKEGHPDIQIREMVTQLTYYLGGVNKTNGHNETINKDSIIRGIAMFRAYKKQLQREGIMVVF